MQAIVYVCSSQINMPAGLWAEVPISSQPKQADDGERAHTMSIWATPQKALAKENKVKGEQS